MIRLRRHVPSRRVLFLVGVPLVLVAVLGTVGHLLTGHGSAGWCAFHGWRALHNLERGHPGWTVYQTWKAVHACT